MDKYLELRQVALNDKAANSKERGVFGQGISKQTINGIEFCCSAIQQSYNGAHAVQVLHYIDGKKVSKAFFVDAIAQIEHAVEAVPGRDSFNRPEWRPVSVIPFDGNTPPELRATINSAFIQAQ